jgi:hypothetical protein
MGLALSGAAAFVDEDELLHEFIFCAFMGVEPLEEALDALGQLRPWSLAVARL